MAVTIDLGDPHDVHFRNKREVTAGWPCCSGPDLQAGCRLFRPDLSRHVQGKGAIRLTFKHALAG